MRNRKIKKVILYTTVAFLINKGLKKLKSRRKKRWWVRPVYQNRDKFGFFQMTFQTMKKDDPEMFAKATRMDVNNFNLLLNLMGPRLEKASPRKPISAECRLALTLM